MSRTTYANLFAAIGTTYGNGDGSTTFNIPDLMFRFMEGSYTAVTVHNAGLPDIYGHIYNFFTSSTSGFDGALYRDNEFESLGWGNIGCTFTNIKFLASRNNTIYGASATVQPPSLTMRFFIKY